jgi:hypothetical protein
MTVKISPEVVDFIKGLESINSNTDKGIIVDLIKVDQETLIYLYSINDEHKVDRTWKDSSRQFRLHELTDELFRLEVGKLDFLVEEGCPPYVTVLSVDVPYNTAEHKLSEISQKYFQPVY